MATQRMGRVLVAVMGATSISLTGVGLLWAQQDAGHSPPRASSRFEERMVWLRPRLEAYGITSTPAGLIAGLDHKDKSARSASLAGIRLLGDLTAIEPVRKLLEDPDPHIRYDTIRTINAIVSRETRSRAQKLYEEAQSEPARFDAAILLCELGDPSQYRHVLPSLEDQANPAFYQALSVVTIFAKYQLFHKGRPVDWVGPISRVLLSRELHPMARADAVIALVEIGSPEALAAMRQALLSATDPSIKARLQAAVDRKD